MPGYYSQRLNASRLQQCYLVAPPRVKQFLEAEILFVLSKIHSHDKVLDLGCGYGRVAFRLTEKTDQVVGIDLSNDNILLARELGRQNNSVQFYQMDAARLTFAGDSFDMTICVQNGISAFNIDPIRLITESLRVTKPGGRLLLSTYSEKFWKERLHWFEIQADHGLIGKINEEVTQDGVIVCEDGFKAITFSESDLLDLSSQFEVTATIFEVDDSSLFCEMIKN